MSRNEEHLDRLLDRAIDQIRETSAEREVVESAADRVWDQLGGVLEKQAKSDPTVAPIRTCSDYQKLIPAYLEGRLGEARRLLLEDHGRECFACRKAIKQARTGAAGKAVARSASRSRARRGRKTDLSWGLAAAAIIVVALVGVAIKTDLFSISTGGLLQVDVVDGNLLNIGDIDIIPVAVGETLDNGEWVRTTKESGAVFTLDDGSRVEMDERSELYVSSRGKDNTIHLARGGIIVEAADQGDGHLFVDASDCQVAVTGTVFSVNRGTKGSRVAVLEGEVVVDLDGNEHVLHPGEQFTTSDNLSPIPMEHHVAWSRHSDRHIALLHSLAEFRKELDERLPEPTNRTSTRLLDAVPEGTVVYVAVPNLTTSITEAHKLLQEKVRTNSALSAWWEENVVATGAEPEIARAMEKIGRFGDQLGEEIVIAVPRANEGDMNAPVFLASLKNPGEFRELLHDELSELHARVKDLPDMRIVENPVSAPELVDGDETMTFWISGDILAVSPEIGTLRHLSSLHGSPGTGRFVGSPFHTRLDEIYREGAGLIIGADLESILADAPMEGQDAQFLNKLGISDVRHLIFERHEDDGRNLTTASLSFNQERRGIMAWLAEPAPMGSLEFISPNAMAVAAFVVRNPASMLGKFLDDLADTDGEFRKELERFQDEFNIDLVQDVAAPLGGEVALALDGPILPTPAWKLVVETYDPAALQRTLEWAVEQANAAAEREGQPFRLELSATERSGRTYHVLTAVEHDLSVHWTYIEGYLVAAPQRVLLDRAIQNRKAGVTLPASQEFLSLLPRDGQTNLSAMAYQNLGPILSPMIQGTLGNMQGLSPDQRRMVDEMSANTRPSMFCAYGWKDRIDVVGADRGGLLGSDLGSLFNLGSLMELRGSLANMPHEPDGSMYH